MTQCGCIRLCNTISMGMTINNCRKLFCYRVKRYHYDKFIGIREFSEKIYVDCFNNNFTTDKWNLEKNIPYLDDIDNEGTVYTCRRLNYSSSSPQNSDISTISDIAISTAPTTAIGHTASKEVELEVWRYNKYARGYLHMRLPNRNIFLKGSIW